MSWPLQVDQPIGGHKPVSPRVPPMIVAAWSASVAPEQGWLGHRHVHVPTFHLIPAIANYCQFPNGIARGELETTKKKCRDAAKIDKTRLATMTELGRAARACQSSPEKSISAR